MAHHNDRPRRLCVERIFIQCEQGDFAACDEYWWDHKQILSIVIALTVFATPVTGMTVAGILITIAGIVMYARESYAEKMRAVAHAEATSPVKAILTTP